MQIIEDVMPVDIRAEIERLSDSSQQMSPMGIVGMRVKTYDLESVGDNADSHGLLSVVAAVHHDRVGQALDDGALGLAETLGGIATGGVRGVDRLADLDVVAVGGQERG